MFGSALYKGPDVYISDGCKAASGERLTSCWHTLILETANGCSQCYSMGPIEKDYRFSLASKQPLQRKLEHF
jgi:hypothetical protein